MLRLLSIIDVAAPRLCAKVVFQQATSTGMPLCSSHVHHHNLSDSQGRTWDGASPRPLDRYNSWQWVHRYPIGTRKSRRYCRLILCHWGIVDGKFAYPSRRNQGCAYGHSLACNSVPKWAYLQDRGSQLLGPRTPAPMPWISQLRSVHWQLRDTLLQKVWYWYLPEQARAPQRIKWGLWLQDCQHQRHPHSE